MLDAIRKRKNNWFFTLLVMGVVVVMAFFGIDQMQNTGSGLGAPVAYVNGEKITQFEFQRELQGRLQQYQAMLGDQYDENLLRALKIPDQTLDGLIRFKLLAQKASSLGIIVPDSELASYIRDLPYFQKDGKFDPELYKRLPNVTIEEKLQRERLQVIKFQDYFQGRVRVTPGEAKHAAKLSETKVNLKYAKVDFNALTNKYAPSKAEIKKTLKEQPQTRFETYYESNKSKYTTKAAYRVKQIRSGFPFQAKTEAKEEAKKKIETAIVGLTPANFSEVAKKHSDDPYAKKGGASGWQEVGTLDPATETALANLKVGEITPTIEGRFGYFVYLLEEKREEKLTPLNQVKEQIAKAIATEDHVANFQKDKLKQWNAQLAKGRSVVPQLKKLKVEVKETGMFSIGENAIPGIGPSDEIMGAVFQLSESNKRPKQLFLYQGNHYYIELAKLEKPKPPKKDKTKKNPLEPADGRLVSEYRNELTQNFVSELQKQAKIERVVRFDENMPLNPY